MNIFMTDPDPYISAINLCDKHIPKMVLESAQMLSTAQRVLGNEDSRLYKIAHKNHPCSIWVRSSASNYLWLYEHFHSLADEYQKRFDNKEHLSWAKLGDVLNTYPTALRGNATRTRTISDPALAMPDEYKETCPYQSYRNYLVAEKSGFAKWERGTPAPVWWI
jgi:hypothetical protein|tara:strand:+ start:47 stop:538 length:492 start_codon:yes stop_codon:yes gene_type:complete